MFSQFRANNHDVETDDNTNTRVNVPQSLLVSESEPEEGTACDAVPADMIDMHTGSNECFVS